MESKCVETAALGRPLYPGTLYDCRSDSVIPGVTLWDKNELRDNLDVHEKPKTHLKFAASDSLSDKANLLDISASLKASFCSGLIEVGGSAKYLLDKKSSADQSRVTMQFSQTTKFEQLTMNELGHITYPQVFDQKTATHVVTAVLYGAHTFMVFDHTNVGNESQQKVEGNLHAVVKKIPNISIEGDASLNLTEDEKEMADNISVTFHGDIELDENPTTYRQAVELYHKLPTLMKQQQDKGVPLTVWLYPLKFLSDNAAMLEREISLSLVSKTESVLEELHEVERRCNDLIKTEITEDFPVIKDRLLKFQTFHKNYTSSFQKALLHALPAIRSGTQEENVLDNIMNIHSTSPLTRSNVNEWFDGVTTELNILSSYTSGLKDLTIVKSLGSLNSILFHPEVHTVVCLSFTSLNYEDSYLAALQDFENSAGLQLEQKSTREFSSVQQWFCHPETSERMRQTLPLFTKFSKANKNDKSLKFIIGSISDPSNPGISIRLYQKGILTDPNFQPVSKPPKPEVEASHIRTTLKLEKSPTGETVHFRIEYRTTEPTDSVADDEEWNVADSETAERKFILIKINPIERYWIRSRAVSKSGVSEASDTLCFTSLKGVPCSPGSEHVPAGLMLLPHIPNMSVIENDYQCG